jgi:hypothetical protein
VSNKRGKRGRIGKVVGTFSGHAPGIPEPECTRCLAEKSRLELAVNSGELEIGDIRQALALINDADPPLGKLIPTKAQSDGSRVYYCPRHTSEKHLVRNRAGKVVRLRV